MHSVRGGQTDRQTDKRHLDANSRSYYVAVRSCKNCCLYMYTCKGNTQ